VLQVAISDYPAPTILDTLATNVSRNIPTDLKAHVTVEGHMWGDLTTPFAISHKEYYDRILAADTLWLPGQHLNLANSMLHFLSRDREARIFVIAGFHTGRAKMASFFDETVPEAGLEIEEIWEMDAEGRRRMWGGARDEVGEKVGERKKWLVIARLRRKGIAEAD
jgi:nicotinamide N-methyltransferase